MVRSKAEIETEIPRLVGEPYDPKSCNSIIYNCFAWAEHEERGWLDPLKSPGNYWPRNVPRERTLDAYTKVYARSGFVEWRDGKAEDGFEKIAIYLDSDNEPSHAARLLKSGIWTSKLGRAEDIEHPRLESLDGPEGFGHVARFMKRPLKTPRKVTARRRPA